MTWVWEWEVEVLTLLLVGDNNSLFTLKVDSQVEDSLGVVFLEDLSSIFDHTHVISFFTQFLGCLLTQRGAAEVGG